MSVLKTHSGIKKTALVFLVIAFCLLSNMVQVLIDTPQMREHASAAVNIIFHQEASPTLVGGFSSARLDNYTSCLIVKTAAYVGPESFWHRAFGGLRVDLPVTEGSDGWGAFCTYATGYDSPTGGLSYSRYWHGYMLPLRLLLTATTFTNIQMFFYGVVFVLTLLLFLSLHKNNLFPLIFPFALSLFSMMPSALGICIQYVPVSIICLLSCLLLSGHYDHIRLFPGNALFFGITGLLTCYYDLLTFPMITLCMPLVILIQHMINHKEPQLFLHTLYCVMGWCIGFFGFWMLKFAMNTFLFGSYDAMNVIQQIKLRISSQSDGTSFSRLDSLISNIYVLLGKDLYRFLFITFIVYEMIRILCSVKKNTFRITPASLLFLIPGVIPVIWMLLTSNHIHDHYYYTYRNLAGTIMAFCMFIETLFMHSRSDLSPYVSEKTQID